MMKLQQTRIASSIWAALVMCGNPKRLCERFMKPPVYIMKFDFRLSAALVRKA